MYRVELQHMLEELLNSIFAHPLSTILPLFVFLIALYKWIFAKTRNMPPSPPKLPFLGHLPWLGLYPHRTLETLSKKYGEVMLIYMGYKPTLVISSASAAKQILKTHDAIFSNRGKNTVADKLLYNSKDIAAAPYGEYWRQMKSIFVVQLLSNRKVRSFRNIREEEMNNMIDKLKKSKDSVVNLSEMLFKSTNDVVCRVAFGRKFSEEKDDNDDVGGSFHELFHELMELFGVFYVGDFIPWLSWVPRFTGLDFKLDKVRKRFDCLLENIIKEHLEHNENEKNTKDFVDVLLEVQRENAVGIHIDKDAIKAIILDAFAAGTHTTATVIEWAMTNLLRNPTIMRKLQEEVRETTRGKEDITQDDLDKMKYLKAVINETLRVHPPIPLLVPHQSIQDVKLNGYDIESKTMVIINAWAIQRDPAIWEEPHKFYPERFLNCSIDHKGQDFELIPFGAGRRICPGIAFAMANNELALAKLIQKFDWKLPDGVTSETIDMSESIGLTAHRKTPLLVIATPHVL